MLPPVCFFNLADVVCELLSSSEEIISAKRKFSRRQAKFTPCLVG